MLLVHILHEVLVVASINACLLLLSEHVVVFVILPQHNLKHIVEESVFLVRSSNPRARFEVAAFVLNCVRYRLCYNTLAKCNKGLAAGSMELVFEVAEGFA